jgi:hypothetical protein
MYSNMDSAGETISVLEELLNEKERRRKCWKKHLCCCFYPKKRVKINSTAITYGRTSEYMDDRGGEHCGTIAN